MVKNLGLLRRHFSSADEVHRSRQTTLLHVLILVRSSPREHRERNDPGHE
jgi:hypothetical protein